MTGTIERRSRPRVELFAQVQLSRDNEVYVMSTENISGGGLFVHGDPQDYPAMDVGSEVELLIFRAEDLMVDLSCHARVIRVEQLDTPGRAGFGLEFVSLDERSRARLQQFLTDRAPEPDLHGDSAPLDAAGRRPPPPPPAPRRQASK